MRKVLFLSIFLIACTGCQKTLCKDEQLNLGKKEFKGALKLNGYYYNIIQYDDRYGVMILYHNGVVLRSSIGYSLNEFESKIKSGAFYEFHRNSKDDWGVFIVNNNKIEVQSWLPSKCKRAVETLSGEVLTDTSFVINKAVVGDQENEINLLYTYRPFSPKPDSTNDFVK